MGCKKLLRMTLLAILICIVLTHRQHYVKATPTNVAENNHIARNRPNRFAVRLASQYARNRQEPDFLLDDDDLLDFSKRQSDDYGHMRFGKRDFDDYGHMRFGRSGSD